MSFLNYPAGATRRYKLATRFKGHTDVVRCLAVSDDGDLLASGGKYLESQYYRYMRPANRNRLAGADGPRLWKMKGGSAVKCPPYNLFQRGSVGCVAWATMRPDKASVIAMGTNQGFLVLWRRSKDVNVPRLPDRPRANALLQGVFEEIYGKRMGFGMEVVCIGTRSERDSIHVVTGSADRLVQVLRLNSADMLLHSVFSVRLEATLPNTVIFAKNAERDVWVFGALDGELCVRRQIS